MVKALKKIPPQDRNRILAKLKTMEAEPFPAGCKKLVGRPAWRVRVGDYRIIYEVQEGALLVLVCLLGHRKEVYRNL